MYGNTEWHRFVLFAELNFVVNQCILIRLIVGAVCIREVVIGVKAP
jgi:hypothetical protein